MKRLIVITFIVSFVSSTFAQKYSFDLLFKYSNKIDNKTQENIVYSKSNNQNYYLMVSNYSNEKIASLYDIVTLKKHYFDVLETKSGNEILFEFKYLYSKPLEKDSGFDKYESETSVIQQDSTSMELKVEIFRNSKRKKTESEFILKCKKVESNFFPVFKFSCLHPFHFSKNIDIQDNILVENAVGNSLHAKKIEHTLLNFKEVIFEIEIPK